MVLQVSVKEGRKGGEGCAGRGWRVGRAAVRGGAALPDAAPTSHEAAALRSQSRYETFFSRRPTTLAYTGKCDDGDSSVSGPAGVGAKQRLLTLSLKFPGRYLRRATLSLVLMHLPSRHVP